MNGATKYRSSQSGIKENTKSHEISTGHNIQRRKKNHPEGVVYVDAIPSPVIEPISPTIIDEQDLTTQEMDVDQ
jgi:hypothetical protein